MKTELKLGGGELVLMQPVIPGSGREENPTFFCVSEVVSLVGRSWLF